MFFSISSIPDSLSRSTSGQDDKKIEAGSVWSESVSLLKDKLDPQIFAAWIKPLTVGEMKVEKGETVLANSLEVLAPNKFCCEHVKNHYGDLISDTVNNVTGDRSLVISFKVGQTVVQKKIQPASASQIAKKKAPARNRRTLATRSIDQTNLNPNYNFSNYVVGLSLIHI